MKNASLRVLMYYFVPAIMLVAFILQLILVEYGNLDRWKGMGMGMFSGISHRAVETVEVKVNGQWIDIRDDISLTHPELFTVIRQFPNSWTEERVLATVKRNEPFASEVRIVVTGVESFDAKTGRITERIVYGADTY